MARLIPLTSAVLVFLLSVIFSDPASAQPTQVIFTSEGPFTNTCNDNGTWLSEDTPVFIYWDRDNNGPDSLDGPICLYTQMCFPEDPRTNMYMFYMDAPGLFVSPIVVVEGLPATARLYLRIFFGANEDSCYTSPLFSLASGPQVIDLPADDWSCGPALARPLPCQTEENIEFVLDGPGPYRECLETCQGGVTEVNVEGGIGYINMNRPPAVVVLSGCEVPCRAATAEFNPSDWYRIGLIDWWVGGRVIGQGRGCVEVVLLDSVPCARVDTFWAEPFQSEIVLHWTTSREEGCRSFEIWRPRWQGYLKYYVGTVASAGSGSGCQYVFTDDSLTVGRFRYSYLLIARDNDSLAYAAMHIPEVQLPSASGITTLNPNEIALHPNYPNPFNARTEITFEIPRASVVQLKVFDVLGREMAALAQGRMAAGSHMVTFDGREFASGLYFCQLEAEGFRAIRKMVLMK